MITTCSGCSEQREVRFDPSTGEYMCSECDTYHENGMLAAVKAFWSALPKRDAPGLRYNHQSTLNQALRAAVQGYLLKTYEGTAYYDDEEFESDEGKSVQRPLANLDCALCLYTRDQVSHATTIIHGYALCGGHLSYVHGDAGWSRSLAIAKEAEANISAMKKGIAAIQCQVETRTARRPSTRRCGNASIVLVRLWEADGAQRTMSLCKGHAQEAAAEYPDNIETLVVYPSAVL